MKVLAIETATPASSIALGDGRATVASAKRVDRRGHAGFLVSAIDFCFDQAGWNPGDLDAIAVDVGPGLYTGIRVGVSTAQGMAAALGVPIVPVMSLDAVALRAATGHRHIYGVVDAGTMKIIWRRKLGGIFDILDPVFLQDTLLNSYREKILYLSITIVGKQMKLIIY